MAEWPGRPGFNEKQMYSKVGPDEGLLMGAVNVIPVNGGGDWVVARPDHRDLCRHGDEAR
jgi:hypothetical protein